MDKIILATGELVQNVPCIEIAEASRCGSFPPEDNELALDLSGSACDNVRIADLPWLLPYRLLDCCQESIR